MENINFKIEERDKRLRNKILITPFYINSERIIDNIELTIDSRIILDNTIDYAKQ